MAYKIHYSDYPGTDTGPPDPERWRGPPGPPGPIGPEGPGKAIIGTTPSVDTFGLLWWDSNSGQLFVQYDDGSSVQWVSANSIDASTLEGSFLPITGGTMQGPLNYTATGGTVSRSAQDRAADIKYVADYGGSIQAAIDALPATGGMVRLSPNTTYTLTATLTIAKPNVIIEAPSWSTIIKRQPGVTGHLINASGSGFVIRDVTVDGGGPAATGGSFEISTNGTDSLVYRCQVINAGAQGHIALNGAGSRAEGNRIIGLGTATPASYGIWAIGGVKTFIVNNRISGTGVDAIGFDGNGTQVIGNHIANCQCYASATTVGGGQIAQYNPNTDGALIANNYIDQGGGALSSGMELWGMNLTVVGNVVVNQNVQGITIGYISGGRPGLLIEGNTVLNNGRGAGSAFTLSGISFFGPLNGVSIIGNRIGDTQATHTQRWGIWIDDTAGKENNNLLIANNDLTGNVTGALFFNKAGTGNVVSNNLGNNDASVPMSGAAMTGPLSATQLTVNAFTTSAPPSNLAATIGYHYTGQAEVNFFNNWAAGSSTLAYSWHQRTSVGGVIDIFDISRQGEFRFTTSAIDGTAMSPYFYSDVTSLHRILVNGIKFVVYNTTLEMQACNLLNDGNQVVGTRKTGWGAPTGTATRTTFATTSVTLPLLAERVKALIDDLTAHGLIGA